MSSTNDNEAQTLEKLALIDNIDATKALRCMSGHTRLYLKLVKDFTNEHQHRSEELTELFATKNWEVLRRRAHSLKTFSAYAGAYHISVLAADMEAQLGKDEHNKTLLDTLCTALDAIVSQLSNMYNASAKAPAEVSFDKNQFKQALTSLVSLLEQSDISAEDLQPELSQMSEHTQYQQDIKSVVEFIEDIEFDEALEIVKQLLVKLD
jgi:HPt (histidine-containing phosphotransfer) domain-containing protein